MNTFKATVMYDGSKYEGLQSQPSKNTIQDQILLCLEKITKSKLGRVLASGRTDAKVHAWAQVIKISIPLDIGPKELKKAINSLLPGDIEILELENCPSSFHPIRDVVSKEYLYLFTDEKLKRCFSRNYVSYFAKSLNIDKLSSLSSVFEGEHNFQHYQNVGSDSKTTIRKIYKSEIGTFENSFKFAEFSSFLNAKYYFYVQGSGFLKQMVRNLMGMLLYAEKHDLSPKDIQKMFLSDEKLYSYATAPPNGLYLYKVNY